MSAFIYTSTSTIATTPLHSHKRLSFPTSLPLKPLSLSTTAISATAKPQPTPTPSLKSRLRNGETLYGIFLLSFSPTIAEIAGLSGFDFAVLDMEHGPGGIPEALHCLRALAGTLTPAILRLPESSPAWAKKALDLGPQGLMFPMIDSPAAAAAAVSFSRFPPAGIRGSAHPVVRASGYGLNEDYLAEYEEDLVVMCQVESAEGAAAAEEIAAVEGVDCVQMGPLDLSASLGYLWDPGNRKVREVMRKAEMGVLGSGGAWLAGFAMPFDTPEMMVKRGYKMVAGTVDVGLFKSAAVEDVTKFKQMLAIEGEHGDEQPKDADDKYWSE